MQKNKVLLFIILSVFIVIILHSNNGICGSTCNDDLLLVVKSGPKYMVRKKHKKMPFYENLYRKIFDTQYKGTHTQILKRNQEIELYYKICYPDDVSEELRKQIEYIRSEVKKAAAGALEKDASDKAKQTSISFLDNLGIPGVTAFVYEKPVTVNRE